MRTQARRNKISSHYASVARQAGGFTLAEVVMSLLIVGSVFGGILMAYVQSGKRAEWSGMSLAAQAYGIQQLEQARAAVWDESAQIPFNQITNLLLLSPSYYSNSLRGYTWTNLDIPFAGTNFVRATNFVVITNVPISVNPAISVTSVQVDTVWHYQEKTFTNRLVNYYAPDQ